MTDLLELAEQLLPVLLDFPADGQLRDVDPETMQSLLLAGFIERWENKKSCPTCGAAKHDHSWFRITGGGRLFMEAMKARHTQAGDAK